MSANLENGLKEDTLVGTHPQKWCTTPVKGIAQENTGILPQNAGMSVQGPVISLH